MQAWKRRVITYQLVNVTALVALTVGASRAMLGQVNPAEPTAPPRPEITVPGFTNNTYDFAARAFSVDGREAQVIADGKQANQISLVLTAGASTKAERATALAQAEALLKPHTNLRIDLLHAEQGTWLPPRVTAVGEKRAAMPAFVAAGRRSTQSVAAASQYPHVVSEHA